MSRDLEAEADSMLSIPTEPIKQEDTQPSIFPSLFPLNSFGYRSSESESKQSLEDILSRVKDTFEDLRPPQNSRPRIFVTWEVLKEIKKDGIIQLMHIIENLPDSLLTEKVKEIEQLALRLDMDQSQEFSKGESMSIINNY